MHNCVILYVCRLDTRIREKRSEKVKKGTKSVQIGEVRDQVAHATKMKDLKCNV
jgi:hypothetical protein